MFESVSKSNPPGWVLVWSLEPDSHVNSKVFETEYQVLTFLMSPVVLALLASFSPHLCDMSVFSAAGGCNSVLRFTFAFSSPVIPSDTFHHMIFR